MTSARADRSGHSGDSRPSLNPLKTHMAGSNMPVNPLNSSIAETQGC
jgi:hypothetical protein